MNSTSSNYPETGQMIFIRQRPALVRNIQEKNDPESSKLQHLIEIEYIDGWNYPHEDTLIWEREITPKIISQADLPNIRPDSKIDAPNRYDAFVNAIRWSTLNRIYLSSNNQDTNVNFRLTSPWYSAVQIEDYQLYPVLKALQMPRVRLLLADDVGLGKTIEAGLIITELINQRRIRRILIVCPASIQIQWQEEMSQKFNLNFKIIDRDASFKIQKELGMDTNAWRTVPRIITSMDYLAQANIFESFKSATESLKPQGGASLPWDLLIIDEAHNFMPSVHGPTHDSQRSRMLRQISKFFEHRLFLTATPHNGFTASFTGLLEILDPLRFTQKQILNKLDHKQINLVMIRRLKSELNAQKLKRRFSNRTVDAIKIELNAQEKAIFNGLRNYRKKALKSLNTVGAREEVLGKFIFTLLKKRLLSSVYAFARTWWAHVAGYQEEQKSIEEAEKSKEMAESETLDDTERDKRESDAVRHGAAWIVSIAPELRKEIDSISSILKDIGFSEEIITQDIENVKYSFKDSKFGKLMKDWIVPKLIGNERVVIFTEYRDTQNYLVAALKKEKMTTPQVQILFGGAPANYREQIKAEFNNPASPLRILIATDTASEGLNLHKACHYLIHQDIPWNPMRIEQRNGRLDRHGQWQDVFTYHFISDEEEDMKFLSYIVKKTNTVREDLGSAGKVLDAAILRHFEEENPDDSNEVKLNQEIDSISNSMAEKEDLTNRDKGDEVIYQKAIQILTETKSSLQIAPDNIYSVFDQALIFDNGFLELVEDKGKYYRIRSKNAGLSSPITWQGLIESSLKIKQGELKGTIPKLFFDDTYFKRQEHGMEVFEIPKDSALIRIGHPVVQKSLTHFRRLLWDSELGNLYRWTILQAKIPMGFDAILEFSYIVSIRNELGELIDSYVEDMHLNIEKKKYSPIDNGSEILNKILPSDRKPLSNEELIQWRSILIPEWTTIKLYLYSRIEIIKKEKNHRFQTILAQSQKKEIQTEEQLLTERLQELEKEDSVDKELKKVEKEKAKLIAEKTDLENTLSQTTLRKYLLKSDNDSLERIMKKKRIEEIEQAQSELEQLEIDLKWSRDTSTTEILKKDLKEEHERIITQIIPKRYTLKSIDIFPVGLRFFVKGE